MLQEICQRQRTALAVAQNTIKGALGLDELFHQLAGLSHVDWGKAAVVA